MLIDWITALWLGLFGACIGSFLNVVAYRMPLGLSVVWKPSHCPQCKHPIRVYDNVPVLGWLILRGKCRDCGQPISPRYALVELVMGLAFVILAYVELFPGIPRREEIVAYGWHAILLSAFMTILLLRLDRNITVMKFIICSALILVCWTLPWYFIRP